MRARAHLHALTNYGSWRSRTVDWRFERAVKTFSNRQAVQNGLAPPSLEQAAQILEGMRVDGVGFGHASALTRLSLEVEAH